MKLEVSNDLKIFCVSIKQDIKWGLPLETMGPLMGQFLLAYSSADLVQTIQEKYPPERFGVMIVAQHGSISLQKVLNQMETEDILNIPAVKKAEQKPNMSKDQFIMNIMLVADDFADQEQAKILRTVLKEIKPDGK